MIASGRAPLSPSPQAFLRCPQPLCQTSADAESAAPCCSRSESGVWRVSPDKQMGFGRAQTSTCPSPVSTDPFLCGKVSRPSPSRGGPCHHPVTSPLVLDVGWNRGAKRSKPSLAGPAAAAQEAPAPPFSTRGDGEAADARSRPAGLPGAVRPVPRVASRSGAQQQACVALHPGKSGAAPEPPPLERFAGLGCAGSSARSRPSQQRCRALSAAGLNPEALV